MPHVLTRDKIAELARRGRAKYQDSDKPVEDKKIAQALEKITEAMHIAAEQNSLAVLGALDGIKTLIEAMSTHETKETPCAWEFEIERDNSGRLKCIVATPMTGMH